MSERRTVAALVTEGSWVMLEAVEEDGEAVRWLVVSKDYCDYMEVPDAEDEAASVALATADPGEARKEFLRMAGVMTAVEMGQ